MDRLEKYPNSNIDKMCEVMARALLVRSKSPGHDVWPEPIFHPAEGNFYIHQAFFQKLFDFINRLQAFGYTDLEIARMFVGPSRLAHYLYLFMERPQSEREISQRVTVAENILKYISSLRIADPFCESDRNILWTDKEVFEALQRHPVVSLEKGAHQSQLRNLVVKAVIMLWTYCELFYFCHLAMAMEIHGPYSASNNESLLVREFYDLRPDIWASFKLVPFERATFLNLYRDMDIKIEFSGRIYSDKPLSQHLMRFCIWTEREGKLSYHSSLEELEQLVKLLERVINENARKIAGLGKKDLIAKYAEVFFYTLKPLGLALGMDWQMPDEVFTAIESTEPDHSVGEGMKALKGRRPNEQLDILKRFFDPRISKV